MRELSPAAIRQKAELLAKEASEDFGRQRRLEKEIRAHIAQTKKTIAESTALLTRLDEAIRRFKFYG